MHKQLACGNGLWKMIVVGDNNTVYLNGAIIPRVKRLDNELGASARSSIFSGTSVDTSDSRGTIQEKSSETWVSVLGTTTLEEEHILFSQTARSFMV